MSDQVWEVVGGGDEKTIIVRSEKDLKSAVSGKLSTGALVKELKLEGQRLKFQRIVGEGPDVGWVSVKVKGKDLVAKADGAKAAEAVAEAKRKAEEEAAVAAKRKDEEEAAAAAKRKAEEGAAVEAKRKVEEEVVPELAQRRKPTNGHQLTRLWSRLAAGHHSATSGPASFYVPPTTPGSGGQPRKIHKLMDEAERMIYEKLNSETFKGDAILPVLAQYHGVIEEHPWPDDEDKQYLVLGNLLYGFECAKVMDVKLGCRSFRESEADPNAVKRPDLYEKLVKIGPDVATKEEHAAKAATKFRFLDARDTHSTTREHCFRIEGMAGYANRSAKEMRQEARHFTTRDDARRAFRSFVLAQAEQDDALFRPEEDEDDERGSAFPGPPDLKAIQAADALLQKLRETKAAMEASAFVGNHECIGTSLLVVLDTKGNAGVFWIDFAKCYLVPEGIVVDHRSPWSLENHEDGIFRGMDNLVEIWADVAQDLRLSATGARAEEEEVARKERNLELEAPGAPSRISNAAPTDEQERADVTDGVADWVADENGDALRANAAKVVKIAADRVVILSASLATPDELKNLEKGLENLDSAIENAARSRLGTMELSSARRLSSATRKQFNKAKDNNERGNGSCGACCIS